jgi:polyisoprenyl-phosphate glycosyltransferase
MSESNNNPSPDVPFLCVGVVIPVYNEENALEPFHRLLRSVIDPMPEHFLIYYVNDGSTDCTAEMLVQLSASDPRVRVLTLVRNFGHQAALTAGLDAADGDVVISMDGDGQHPPALIPKMLALYQAGYEIVQTQRLDDERANFFKRLSSNSFYWLIQKMSSIPIQQGTADFRLMSRDAVESLKNMREYHRFLRGMIPWMGFNSVILPFNPADRLSGKSKYTLTKMSKLAEDAIFSFSLLPVRIALICGGIFFILALFEVVNVLFIYIQGKTYLLVPGWSSLMFISLINSGLILVNIGIVGTYIAFILQEVKNRPIYILKKDVSSSALKESRTSENK